MIYLCRYLVSKKKMPRKVKQDDTVIRKKKKNKKQILETFGKYTTKHVRLVENLFFQRKKKKSN